MSTVSFKYPLQTLSIGPMVCFTLDIIRLGLQNRVYVSQFLEAMMVTAPS